MALGVADGVSSGVAVGEGDSVGLGVGEDFFFFDFDFPFAFGLALGSGVGEVFRCFLLEMAMMPASGSFLPRDVCGVYAPAWEWASRKTF